MLRGAMLNVLGAGKFGPACLALERLPGPFIARVVRSYTRPSLPFNAAGNGAYAPSALPAKGKNIRNVALVISRGIDRKGLSERGHIGKMSFCTTVFSKPAVDVLIQTPIHEAETVVEMTESDGDDGTNEEDVRPETQTDPWILRQTPITFNKLKFPEKPEGLSFNVSFMDTGSEWTEEKKRTTPTVLAIPGQPGNHDDMLPVVRPLYDEGRYRVVIVNMPGYECTVGFSPLDTDLYRNSSADLADFVVHFIESLQLARIDMVVTHSAGSVPLLILLYSLDIVRSAMVICTPSYHVPSRVYRPLWFIKGLVELWDTRPGRSFVKLFLPKFNEATRWINSNDATLLMNCAKFGANTNFALLTSLTPKIGAKNIPIVYVASENDKLVELKNSLEWAAMLGIHKELFESYDENFRFVEHTENTEKTYPKGVLLKKGGHYPQRKEVALPVLLHEAKCLLNHVLQERE